MVMAPVALVGFLFAQNGNSTKSTPPVTQSGTIPAQPFPGQRVRAIPAVPAIPAVLKSKFICPKTPQFSVLSSLDPSWSMNNPVPVIDGIAYYYGIEVMLKSKSGALFVAGYKTTASSYHIMHTSTDNGVTWKPVELPIDKLAYWNIVVSIVEDKNGVIYAGGTSLWKSADGGNTWEILPMPYPDTYYGGFRPINEMFITQDNSLIASFPGVAFGIDGMFFGLQPGGYMPAKAYKSTNGGNSWNELFSHNYLITSIVEAGDGALVFRDYVGSNVDSVYRYSGGVITKTFTNPVALSEPNIGLLKATDGALYLTAVDTAFNPDTMDYEQPGFALLAAYKSVDNGMTWTKLGMLPNSWTNQGSIIEATDGSMYASSFSLCDRKDSVYKSTDKGVTWSTLATAPNFKSTPRAGYYFKIFSILEVSGKVLIVGNAPVIFSTK